MGPAQGPIWGQEAYLPLVKGAKKGYFLGHIEIKGRDRELVVLVLGVPTPGMIVRGAQQVVGWQLRALPEGAKATATPYWHDLRVEIPSIGATGTQPAPQCYWVPSAASKGRRSALCCPAPNCFVPFVR